MFCCKVDKHKKHDVHSFKFAKYKISIPELLCEMSVIEKFEKFTAQHLWKGPFLNKVAISHRSFPVNLAKFLRTLFFRSSHPEVFFEKGVPKICKKSTGEHPYWSTIWIKLQSNFTEITLRHSSVNFLQIFRTPFHKNTSGWLLLCFYKTALMAAYENVIPTDLKSKDEASWNYFTMITTKP